MSDIKYLKTIGFNSNQPIGRGFNYPYDIDFSSDGRIFLINRMGGLNSRGVRIQVFTYEEEWLEEFGTGPGTENENFVTPVCLSFDAQDRVFITDEYLNEIKIFDSKGTFLERWGQNDSPRSFQGPAGIGHSSDDSVFVVEQYKGCVTKLSPSGEFLSSWGREGAKPGEFNLPWGLTLDKDDNVFVADWRNDRIQKFSCNGDFIDSYGISGTKPGEFHRPSSVAVDSKGMIYVADWGNERVQILTPDGEFHQLLRGEATLSNWAEEWLEVNPDEYDLRKESELLVDNLPEHLQTPYHTSSQTEPIFWGPVSVKIDTDDKLFVTEHSRHRIQVYSRS